MIENGNRCNQLSYADDNILILDQSTWVDFFQSILVASQPLIFTSVRPADWLFWKMDHFFGDNA